MTSPASTLRAAVGAVVALLLLLGGARLVVGHYVVSRNDERVHRATAAAAANDDLLLSLTEAQTGLRGYQLTGDPSLLDSYRRGLAGYATARSAVREAADRDPLRALVAAEIDEADAWVATSAPLGDAVGIADVSVVRRGEQQFDRLRSANARAATGFDADLTAARAHARSVDLIGDLGTALLAVLAAGLVLGLGRRVHRATGPFEEIRTVLARIRAGDRSARARPAGPPSAREAVEALNELAEDHQRLHSSESGRAEARQRAHDLGATVRASLDPEAILDEAVAGLGAVLEADHVYLRLADGTDRLWSRPGLDAPPIESLRADEPMIGAALTTVFSIDAESTGALVLARSRPWSDDDRVLLDAVAADTGRGLHVAQVYDHQRELAERFQDLDRQKTDFISTVSHELRTPLTSILGYLEILLSGDQGELTDPQERSLRVVERNAERLRELVGDLLTLSRIGSGNLEMTATRVEVTSLLDGVREVFGPVAAGAGVTLETDRGDGLAVVGDDRQLERVLHNVVGNAVKFTPAGGSVRVRVRGDEARVSFEVADTGMGIPAADQDRLFQPFQRASNAVASAVQGTGLGLAIARSIVERHGGEVTLRSAVGQGTTVTIALPRALGATTGSDTAVDPREAAIRAAKARALSRASAR
ncbi:ATP-binding protein [Cryptosporangium arvum]|uniref:histidine kinase n=1 Tax=Cryptosporangium arvum DSM 44712 TaxID=927661 RepID=A0A011AFY9_9ACTN|nr:ATP-binding protein [Cryptosporangium arvum]EXG80941.1 signal transduction histidine kinase [Cryptosporangium arvum DSM 44712]